MQIATLIKPALAAMLLGAALHASAAAIATFDDLPNPPAINTGTGLQYTNFTNSLDYAGVTWDARFSVVGDAYRVGGPSGPTFGIAHSGHYFVTNQDGNSGLTITTDKVLTGAWFGRNQYYGYSEGGADQVTIVAVAGGTDLASIVFNLPDTHPGLPEPLSFIDTSSFASLSGITGYRIDRHELGTQSGHWVADDFQFAEVSNVPEPATWTMLAAGLGWLAWRRRRRA
ncbi:hypothetical protein GCM10027277_20650 [Pseudoduganella ginsengisoli]|nr:PEP-CTERM sorting domain-containing protein [Pseudoduganella ginsengisoli]